MDLDAAGVGLAVNGFSAWMTHAGGAEGGRPGMAVRAVFVHVLSDLIGTFGVMLAGALVYFFGWGQADALISLLIGALVLYSSWGLVREGVDVLMESVPAHIDLEELRHDLLAIRDTEEVHDLHVWCLASRQFALSAHGVNIKSAGTRVALKYHPHLDTSPIRPLMLRDFLPGAYSCTREHEGGICGCNSNALTFSERRVLW